METLTPAVRPEANPHGPFAALRRVFPAGEVIRFLMVGGFNTVCAIFLYWVFLRVYTHLLPTHGQPLIADLASITSKPIAITIAFLGFKHFVFRTHGNYLKEWLKCFAVYGVSTPVELIILPLATKVFLLSPYSQRHAALLAGLFNTSLVATYSYFAHKKFSFRR